MCRWFKSVSGQKSLSKESDQEDCVTTFEDLFVSLFLSFLFLLSFFLVLVILKNENKDWNSVVFVWGW